MHKKHSFCIAWGLLFVWVFYTIIHTGFALFQLHIHHQTVAYRLKYKKEKKLVHLILSPRSENFIRINKKEFVWQGEWYDIERITEKNGMMHIVAYPDKKEKKLQKRLAEAVQKEQKDKNNLISKLEIKESYLFCFTFLFIVPGYKIFNRYEKCADTKDIVIPLFKPPQNIFRGF